MGNRIAAGNALPRALRARACGVRVALVAALLALPAVSRAQQPSSNANPAAAAAPQAAGGGPASQSSPLPANATTPLAEQNLSLVAASATDITAVLKTQPGLMVELKRWVAEEATSRGQILVDSDLTDDAVYNRLQSDVKFRGVATLLLQRYGYLLPQVNPLSQQGQQQELLMKERTAQIARIQEEANTAPLPQPPAQKAEASSTCNPLQDPSCFSSKTVTTPGFVAGLGGSPVGGSYPYPYMGTLPVMPYSTPFLEQQISAPLSNPGLGQAGALGAAIAAGSDSGSSLSQSILSQSAGGLGQPSPLALGSGLDGYALGGGPNEAALAGGSQPAVYQPWYAQPGTTRVGGAGVGATPGMVRRPDPFSGVPSLYDMYMQAAPQPQHLERFGEAVFTNTPAASQLIPMDLPASPDYVVGPGDVLTVSMWGGVSARFERTVDRTGRVLLPEVGPVSVTGKTLGDVQNLVQGALRTQYRGVSADVSLTLIRSVRVYVVGDVVRPGAYDVSSLSTPLNAELAAGGPTPNGSIRMLQHWRQGKLLQTLDVYKLLLHGITSDVLPLENGDTVRVPTVGPQVTVEGMVRRPDIYELDGETTLAQVLQLAGGVLPTATLDHIEVDQLVAHQKRTMLSLNFSEKTDPADIEKKLAGFTVGNGDRIDVFPIAPYTQGAVYLEGHVLRPGTYAYSPGMKLTDLIASYKALLPMPANYAEIIRLSPPDFHPTVLSVNLRQAMADPAAAPKLEPLDTVRIYSRYDFTSPPTVYVGGDVRHPGLYRTDGQVHLSDAIALAGGVSQDADLNYAQVFHPLSNGRMKVSSVNLEKALNGKAADNVLLGSRDLVVVPPSTGRVDPAVVYIEGEVNHPGRYPLTVDMRVADLIRMGGGLRRSADPGVADLMRYIVHDDSALTGKPMTLNISRALDGDPRNDLVLHDGDVLTIRELPGWNDIGASVTVSGEVVHPGTYPIRPGERLSAVLEQAGGFLPTAYPQGIVFERAEVRTVQEESKQQLIQQLRVQSAAYSAGGPTSIAQAAALQEAAHVQSERAIQALEQAPVTGRMVIRMPAQLSRFRGSANDIILRGGDSIQIPKRPDFVLVNGQVYNSNAITYMPHRDAEWYVRQAGGPTQEANVHATFIIRANGSIVSGHSGGWWSHGSVLGTQIEPGDTIVVPEKIVGGSVLWRNLLGVAQMAASAAVTAGVAANF